MPFHPLFPNGSNGPNVPMPTPINPTLSVAAMTGIPPAPLATQTIPEATLPALMPVVPAPLPSLTTPGVAAPVVPAAPLPTATPFPTLTTPGAVAPATPTTPEAGPPGSVEPTLTGKENELPAKKKRKWVEPADTEMQRRPQCSSKPPTHLKDGGYVPPSKGTRKQAVMKPAAKKKKK
ncbi:hypothetical protein PLEOSDRAFT_169880 [Pleurotus ostreatus PC15]|uniref:Uncharacterized protein n=1 Tax=Pleurotus ostreatus (strain PC15) TaxID=1137138 RepID=A0A067NR08_PLEO1|nr:hypothetical protein PLEOSDRAFT_169880 [Pleurotus ostreatus PC15]